MEKTAQTSALILRQAESSSCTRMGGLLPVPTAVHHVNARNDQEIKTENSKITTQDFDKIVKCYHIYSL